MSFASPVLLLGLAVVPLALWAYRQEQRRRRRYAVRFPGVPTLASVTDPVSPWRRHLPVGLFALALAILALAIARPQATVGVPIERASIVLVTDVSRSMRATDVEPTRLDAAKDAARRFLRRLPRRLQVGAVAFSSAPHTVLRPSQDRAEVEALIEELAADGSTATGDALAATLGLFPERRERRLPAAIVLLSDGKTTTGQDPVEVAREAGRRKVPIYTVALGTDSGVLPGGPYGRGLPVPPDPKTLEDIAEESGGRAFSADDSDELDTIYEKLGSDLGTKEEKREITAGFAAGGLVLLVMAAAVSVRAFGRLP